MFFNLIERVIIIVGISQFIIECVKQICVVMLEVSFQVYVGGGGDFGDRGVDLYLVRLELVEVVKRFISIGVGKMVF